MSGFNHFVVFIHQWHWATVATVILYKCMLRPKCELYIIYDAALQVGTIHKFYTQNTVCKIAAAPGSKSKILLNIQVGKLRLNLCRHYPLLSEACWDARPSMYDNKRKWFNLTLWIGGNKAERSGHIVLVAYACKLKTYHAPMPLSATELAELYATVS